MKIKKHLLAVGIGLVRPVHRGPGRARHHRIELPPHPGVDGIVRHLGRPGRRVRGQGLPPAGLGQRQGQGRGRQDPLDLHHLPLQRAREAGGGHRRRRGGAAVARRRRRRRRDPLEPDHTQGHTERPRQGIQADEPAHRLLLGHRQRRGRSPRPSRPATGRRARSPRPSDPAPRSTAPTPSSSARTVYATHGHGIHEAVGSFIAGLDPSRTGCRADPVLDGLRAERRHPDDAAPARGPRHQGRRGQLLLPWPLRALQPRTLRADLAPASRGISGLGDGGCRAAGPPRRLGGRRPRRAADPRRADAAASSKPAQASSAVVRTPRTPPKRGRGSLVRLGPFRFQGAPEEAEGPRPRGPGQPRHSPRPVPTAAGGEACPAPS
ncbi:MAG: hypothetical protein MZV70_56810 [Desulfobacterales bacterium]|nr:hypothetical protein [Desulfobacterales bacterium]